MRGAPRGEGEGRSAGFDPTRGGREGREGEEGERGAVEGGDKGSRRVTPGWRGDAARDR